MKLLIRGGRVVDPASGRDEVADLAIASGRVVGIGPMGDFEPERVIDATGLVVAPGLVDLSARLREPGREHQGMLESELQAAAAGGRIVKPATRTHWGIAGYFADPDGHLFEVDYEDAWVFDDDHRLVVDRVN